MNCIKEKEKIYYFEECYNCITCWKIYWQEEIKGFKTWKDFKQNLKQIVIKEDD